ncbi:Cas9 inhibitor AcrIIA9 family protein [Emergencia sp. JLR.KK010]|uniref:Cas9 inhibitor AcrIIA9 family protein n=1 Tax=Emergencia sp. JLR.KK010 TaxID=3114296 RepID=UPI0030CA8380
MSKKTDDAIAKITAECEGKEYLIPFEEYLTSICNDAVAEKILKDDKKLEDCFKKMKEVARSRQKNGCAYIPNEEGFEIIRDYYGITCTDLRKIAENVIDITDLL